MFDVRIQKSESNKGNGCGESNKTKGNITERLDTNEIPNMTKQEIIDSIPDDWEYTEHNGFVHIKDETGKMRIRIDPPDKMTNIHMFMRMIIMGICWIDLAILWIERAQQDICRIKIRRI